MWWVGIISGIAHGQVFHAGAASSHALLHLHLLLLSSSLAAVELYMVIAQRCVATNAFIRHTMRAPDDTDDWFVTSSSSSSSSPRQLII
jgi:hypothetical protein